jgi:hypothetical protein
MNKERQIVSMEQILEESKTMVIDKGVQEVPLKHYDVVNILQIINTMEESELIRPDVDIIEVDILRQLKFTVLKSITNTYNRCVLKLTSSECYLVWNCLDLYVEFCKSVGSCKEQRHYEKLMKKFRGR